MYNISAQVIENIYVQCCVLERAGTFTWQGFAKVANSQCCRKFLMDPNINI